MQILASAFLGKRVVLKSIPERRLSARLLTEEQLQRANSTLIFTLKPRHRRRLCSTVVMTNGVSKCRNALIIYLTLISACEPNARYLVPFQNEHLEQFWTRLLFYFPSFVLLSAPNCRLTYIIFVAEILGRVSTTIIIITVIKKKDSLSPV